MTQAAPALETLRLTVPEHALEVFEAALAAACPTVGLFVDEATGLWTVEAVKPSGESEAALETGLALARAGTGLDIALERTPVAADGWLARTASAFPEQRIGRVVIRGTHLPKLARPGHVTLVLDAAAAFGSGEHGSTRGCLLALQRVLRRHRPRRILDLGTGTGILGMAASRLTGRAVRASDIDPWSVRTARDNARRNGVRLDVRRSDGWHAPHMRAGAPYDLVLANILARPLIGMAGHLAAHLAPGGVAILSGLLARQARWVLAAHRPLGLRLEFTLRDHGWATLVLRRPPAAP
jgi:ribosomal protein L11 methyltransferase